MPSWPSASRMSSTLELSSMPPLANGSSIVMRLALPRCTGSETACAAATAVGYVLSAMPEPRAPSQHGGAAPPEGAGLDVLRRAAAGCRACDLWRGATQTVFGEGP